VQIAQNQTWCGRMLALLLVMGSLVLFMTSAKAAEFPTSENPAKGNWTAMKPSSFPASLTSILEQCNRAAHVSNSDRLTTAMCQKLPSLVSSKRCKVDMVPDDLVLDYMNGRESGQSRLTFGVKKALGRSDRATICDLGNRTFAYWFTGEKGKSCNNVGIVFTAPPRKVAPPPPLTPIKPAPDPGPLKVAPPVNPSLPEVKTADPAPLSENCRWVLTGSTTTATQVIEIQGRILDSCLGPWPVPGQISLIPGGVVTTRTWVCN
jgi:hypothetical protein